MFNTVSRYTLLFNILLFQASKEDGYVFIVLFGVSMEYIQF